MLLLNFKMSLFIAADTKNGIPFTSKFWGGGGRNLRGQYLKSGPKKKNYLHG